MEFSYENHGANTYLVYEFGQEDVIDSMTLGMLTHNTINGLATATFTQMDAQKFIRYNVTSHVPVAQVFSGIVRRKQLLGVFYGIVSALCSAEEYMIDETSMVLDLEYMFTDVSTYKTMLICLPVERKVEPVNLCAFFKEILFRIQTDQDENCDYVAQLINHLNSIGRFSLSLFKELLEQLQEEPKKKIAEPVQPQVIPVTKKAIDLPKVVEQPVVTVPESLSTSVQTLTPEQRPKSLVTEPPVKQKPEEPKISTLYLLQHYNAETAARYKAQKESEKVAKRNKGKEEKSQKEKPSQKEKKSKKSQTAATEVSFSVPGAPNKEISYTVPGAPKNNAEFAVPGQGTVMPAISKPSAQPAVPVASPAPVQVTPPTPVVPQTSVHTVPTEQSKGAGFGETIVLTKPVVTGETTALNQAATVSPPAPCLIRQKNNERIPLNKPVFRIGKERSYVDYFIGDNSAISRSHANIITRDGGYYVVDTNSTNHTYLNGTMISSNEEYTLTDGAKLRLANEEFEFRVL